jgi:hypothetical protein
MSDWDLLFSNNSDFNRSEDEAEYFKGGSTNSSTNEGELPAEAIDYSILNCAHVARQRRQGRGCRATMIMMRQGAPEV